MKLKECINRSSLNETFRTLYVSDSRVSFQDSFESKYNDRIVFFSEPYSNEDITPEEMLKIINIVLHYEAPTIELNNLIEIPDLTNIIQFYTPSFGNVTSGQLSIVTNSGKVLPKAHFIFSKDLVAINRWIFNLSVDLLGKLKLHFQDNKMVFKFNTLESFNIIKKIIK